MPPWAFVDVPYKLLFRGIANEQQCMWSHCCQRCQRCFHVVGVFTKSKKTMADLAIASGQEKATPWQVPVL